MGGVQVTLPWAIYRDGGRWLSYAPTLHLAIEYATPELAKPIGAEKHRCGLASIFAPDVLAPAVDLSAPTLFVQQQRHGVAVLWVWQVGSDPRVLRVERSLSVPFEVVAQAVLRCAAALAEVPEHQRLHVDRFKTGKRVGQLRFTSWHDAAKREEIIALDAANQAADRARAAATANLASTLDVLTSEPLVVPPALDLASVLRWTELLGAVRDSVTDYELIQDMRRWATDARKSLADARAALESVRDFGFEVGSICHTPRDPRALVDEISPFGACLVRGARVCPDGEHIREIEDAAGREWTCGVKTLRTGAPS